jgi:hypothetical protein
MGVAQDGLVPQGVLESYLGLARRRYGPMPMAPDNSQSSMLTSSFDPTATNRMVFMHGGIYKLCYTPDAPFGGDTTSVSKENVMDITIRVLGIKSQCLHGYDDGCIAQERWDCSYGYKGESILNCEFNFATDAGRPGWGITLMAQESGTNSFMTWSRQYGNDQIDSSTGQLQGTVEDSYEKEYCGSDPTQVPLDYS